MASAVTSNPPQVRVFTFSVGQHNYDVTPLQWMACANKGTSPVHHCQGPACHFFLSIAYVVQLSIHMSSCVFTCCETGPPPIHEAVPHSIWRLTCPPD